MPAYDDLDQLIARLQQHLPADRSLAAEDLADLLWLARSMVPAATADATERTAQAGAPVPAETPADAGEDPPQPPAKPEPKREPAASTVVSETNAKLYADPGDGADATQTRGRPFRTPAGAALPHKLALGRALRPFKQRSERHTKQILDAVAIAEQAAETGYLILVLRPATERRFDVALVLDESPSMLIWQQTVRELHRLLLHHGAFRDVGLWSMQGDDSGNIQLYRGIGTKTGRGRPCKPGELVDPQGRRLILVVSDTVASIWRSGTAYALLAEWGRQNLVTLVQVLPQDLWQRTSLGYLTDILLSPAPGANNNRLLAYDHDDAPFGQARLEGLAIPVVTLEADRLQQWASALMNGDARSIVGYVLEVPFPACTDEMEAVQRQSIAQRYRVFKATASATARKLAGLFAAAPLTLHTMRLIQSQLLPEAGQVHLAEIMLSGLIRRKATSGAAETDPEYVAYEFLDEARQLLGNDVPIPATYQVLELLSPRIAELFGRPDDFMSILADEIHGTVQFGADTLPLAALPPSVLRRVGLADLANYLERSLDESSELFSGSADFPPWLQNQPVGSEAESSGAFLGVADSYPGKSSSGDIIADINEVETPADPVATARAHITLMKTTQNARMIWDTLGTLLEQLGTTSSHVSNEVEAEYRSALLETDDPLLHYTLGIVQQQIGQHSLALLEFEQALALLETDAHILLSRVLIYQAMADSFIALGQAEEALEHLRQGREVTSQAQIDPSIKHPFATPLSQGDLTRRIAEVYAATDDLDGAEQALLEARRLLPYDRAIYTKLADVYFRQGKLKDALNQLEDLASHYEERKDLDRTIETLEYSLKLAPRDTEIGGRLARLYLRRGLLDRGLETLSRVAEFQRKAGQLKDAVASLQQAADVYWTLGKHEEAQALYDKIIQIAPNDVEARQWLAIMYTLSFRTADAIAEKKEIVRILTQQGDYENAIAELHQIIGLDPHDLDAYYVLGDMLMRREEYAQAIHLYDRMLKLDGVNIERIEALISAANQLLGQNRKEQ